MGEQQLEPSDLGRFVARARATRQHAWSMVERLQEACLVDQDPGEKVQALQFGWLEVKVTTAAS